VPEILDTSVIDEVLTVTTEEAMVNARRLAMEEGLLVGISSGANLAACLKVLTSPRTSLGQTFFELSYKISLPDL
jgi:cysteine synthase